MTLIHSSNPKEFEVPMNAGLWILSENLFKNVGEACLEVCRLVTQITTINANNVGSPIEFRV